MFWICLGGRVGLANPTDRRFGGHVSGGKRAICEFATGSGHAIFTRVFLRILLVEPQIRRIYSPSIIHLFVGCLRARTSSNPQNCGLWPQDSCMDC